MAITPEQSTIPYAMLRASGSLDFAAGSAEPWIADVVAALAIANATCNAIEIGGFQGRTSEALSLALAKLPWSASLTVCEIDPDRAFAVETRLDLLPKSLVRHSVVCMDSHDWLPTLAPRSVDFAWIDGNHTQNHVDSEIELLMSRLAPGGLIALHDVFGVCDLQAVVKVWGGYSLDLTRLGPAGGIGLLQRPR